MTNGTAISTPTTPAHNEAASAKRNRIEFVILVMAAWFFLIATTTLVVSSFGTFSDYQQLIWCSALFGLGIGCGGGLVGLKWLPRVPERTGAIVGSTFLLMIVLSLLVVAYEGSIYDLNMIVSAVIRDNSAAMFKDRFVGEEVVRQFLAPLFLYSLLILPSLFLVPIGREIQSRSTALTGRDTFLWFSVATAAAWSIILAALLSPYFIVLLPFVFGLSVIFTSPKNSLVASVVALVLTGGALGIYLTDWKGGWKGTDSIRPELREVIRRIYDCGSRVDIFPMMSGESFSGLMSSLNRLPYGLTLKPGLSGDDAIAVNKNVNGLEGLVPDFHSLAFANTSSPETKSVLIVGPTPGNLTSAALQKGFERVTVVCRSTIDYAPLELLHIANEKVHVVKSDPFVFLNSAPEKFDVIALTGRYSHQTINVLAPMAKDDFLYTTDTFRMMGDHLNPGGCISVEYTELDRVSLNRLASTILNAGQLFTSQYETVGGGFLTCATSAGAGKPDAATLTQLQDRWGKEIYRDPEAINGKLQVKAESPWTLNYPFRNYALFRVLDLGHVSATTVVTVIVFLLIRWSALGSVMFTANRPAIMASAAAFVCIAGKASMLLAEFFGAAEPFLLIVQSLIFVLFLVAVPIAINPLRLQPWILSLSACVLIVTGLVVESGAGFASSVGLVPGLLVCVFDLLPAVLIAGALGCYVRDSQDSARALSALVIGMSMGFLLNYSAIYGGINFLGVTGLILLSAVLLTVGSAYVQRMQASTESIGETKSEPTKDDSAKNDQVESEPATADSSESDSTTGDTNEGINQDAVQ